VPFSTWELPELSVRWCLKHAGIDASELDAVTYSFDPALTRPVEELGLDDPWDHLRVMYAKQAPSFIATAFPGIDPAIVRYVPHHVAHAASAGLASPHGDADVLVLDGRGESASHLAGHYADGLLEVLASQQLPHSLGLMYEDLTAHLGFLRSSDEYKVMALASYGEPRFAELAEAIYTTGDGGFRTERIEWGALVKARTGDEPWTQDHADLAASVQRALEDVLLELAAWQHARTGADVLTLAGGVALNCVANTRLRAEGPYRDVWVQPAAGDAGPRWAAPCTSPASWVTGRSRCPGPTRPVVQRRRDRGLAHDRPGALRAPRRRGRGGRAVPGRQRRRGVVPGRERVRPRALGHRSLLAHPGHDKNLERINDVKGREQFRPVAPMVLAERAEEIFSRGPVSSPYMLFVHDVAPSGAIASRPSSTSTAPRACRRSTVRLPAGGPHAGRVRAADRPAGGGEHQPQHGGAAHGRRPARCARVLRVGTGRPARDRLLRGAAPGGGMTVPTTVVVPTVGRPSLTALLQALGRASGPRPVEVLVVDDRPDGGDLTAFLPGDDVLPVRVLRSGGRGPAAARNVGWRHARTEWVSFLDDDVLPDDDWPARLAEDLAGLAADVAASQGRVRVPLPADRRAHRLGAAHRGAGRRPVDHRRHQLPAQRAGAGRRLRRALPARLPEDADLALRVEDDGGRLVVGDRWITHPVRPVDDWVSLRTQAGNADDPLMTRLHGPDWYERAGRDQGSAVAARRHDGRRRVGPRAGRSPSPRLAALATAAGWPAGVELAWARIAPGPRDRAEVRRMLLTSFAIPPAATWHTLRGQWQHRAPRRGAALLTWSCGTGTARSCTTSPTTATLLWSGPSTASHRRSSGCARRRARRRGDQPVGGRHRAHHSRADGGGQPEVERLLGPFDVWQVCPHAPADGCGCRKPAPGLVKEACTGSTCRSSAAW
jgi:carbamoyltransferase